MALALALPKGPERDLFLSMTYAIVIFSVAVQGLTLGRVAHAFQPVGSGGMRPPTLFS